MMFKKILLASAVASLSTASFAMQSMDDAALSETTGQDGITAVITTVADNFDVYVHDVGGFTGATSAGAIVLKDINLGANTLTVDIDAGSQGQTSTSNTLQVKLYSAAAMTIDLGSVRVGNSAKDDATPGWGLTGTAPTNDLIDLGSVTIGASSAASPLLNIQFGHEAQGAWMKLTPTLTGGLSIAGLKLKDGTVATAGIGIDTLSVNNATGATADLNADVSIDGTNTGLLLTLNTVGSGGANIRMAGLRLGQLDTTPSPAIGDVEVVGLNLAGTTIRVLGH